MLSKLRTQRLDVRLSVTSTPACATGARLEDSRMKRRGWRQQERVGVARLRAFPTDGGGYTEEEEPSRDDMISKLNASMDASPEPMDGQELKELVMARWGRLYDTRICRRRDGLGQMRLYLQVMWKFLGQRSFPLSASRYDEQLGAVAELVSEWGCADQIRREIPACKKNPILDTTGAHAVMIALDVQDAMMDEFL